MHVFYTRFLSKPGGDLLSRALRQSTIGAKWLNDRVRNGIGWGPLAITTWLTQKSISSIRVSVMNRFTFIHGFAALENEGCKEIVLVCFCLCD